RRRLARHHWLSDLPAMLFWALVVGALAALTTIGFHQGMRLVQYLATGHSGSIVEVITGLPWWGRVLFPTVGGVLAGTLLWLAGRIKSGSQSGYMEAVAI